MKKMKKMGRAMGGKKIAGGGKYPSFSPYSDGPPKGMPPGARSKKARERRLSKESL